MDHPKRTAPRLYQNRIPFRVQAILCLISGFCERSYLSSTALCRRLGCRHRRHRVFAVFGSCRRWEARGSFCQGFCNTNLEQLRWIGYLAAVAQGRQLWSSAGTGAESPKRGVRDFSNFGETQGRIHLWRTTIYGFYGIYHSYRPRSASSNYDHSHPSRDLPPNQLIPQ